MSECANCNCEGYGVTSAHYETTIPNNATWQESIQFGQPTGVNWTLLGCTFSMEVQRNRYDRNPLMLLTTANGRIVIADPIQRIIYFNVAMADIQLDLPVGIYVYDLVMTDASIPPVRTSLLHGTICVKQGVTTQ